jgi:hypothetical protein
MFVTQFRAAALALFATSFIAIAAAAAPVSLRYGFDGLVSSTAYHHWCYDYPIEEDYDHCAEHGGPTTYQGPPLSSRGTGSFTISFDPDDPYVRPEFQFTSTFRDLFAPSMFTGVPNYTPAFQRLSFETSSWDDNFRISLNPGMNGSIGGSAYFYYEQNASGANWAEVKLRLYNVTVTDLTEMAPVPLPAALPLLGAGLAGLGLVGRRRRRA